MKKIIVSILVFVIGLGVYVFFNKKEAEPRCGVGFRFVPSSQSCEPVEKPKETIIDFSKVLFKVPETTVEVQLQKSGDTTKYTAVYKDEKDPLVKGSVSLETKDLIQFSPNTVIASFVLDTGGSGQFVYIGLFNTESNTHLSSIFVGDRITISSTEAVDQKIKVNFKTRLDSESFAIEPTIPAQAVFEIRDNAFVELMRLQNADYRDVEIKSPAVGTPISKKLIVKGAVPGTWYFEASAQFKILDDSYNEIAFGNITALSDWMTTQRVPFELSLTIGDTSTSASSTTSLNYKGDATIIIQSENVEGGETGERLVKKMYIPVTIK
jgi:hypothetical protein